MGPGDLEQVLKSMPASLSKELLVGLDTRDDAAIFKIGPETALVQTLDFFTPIVDDPYLFGQIAAANALSDIYAMGGAPLTAMNLAGFPCDLDLDILAEIFRGGRDKVEEAGAIVVGGHTVEDKEPKYGLSVTGLINPKEVITISGAKLGDRLILTKPLGVGILSTALKGEFITEDDMKDAIEGMSQLNAAAAEVMKKTGVNAATDVTGFGFLGHLRTMARTSGVAVRIKAGAIPVWPEVRELARQGMVPAGAAKNRDYLEGSVSFDSAVDPVTRDILFDPQTSGGLLISVSKDRVEQLLALLGEARTLALAQVGEIVQGKPGQIEIRGVKDAATG